MDVLSKPLFFLNCYMCFDISFIAKLKELSAYFPEMVDSPQLELDFESDHIIAHRYGLPDCKKKH